MGDKEGFSARLKDLRINVDALDKVSVPEIGMEIPNVDGKRGSLQIYAAITSPDGYISPDDAKRGLSVFGEEYQAEAIAKPGSHPSISGLIKIVESGSKVRSDVYRNPSVKMHPFSDDVLAEAAEKFGTPVIVYHEATIRARMRALNSAFSWVPTGFMNHIAVKATDCAPIIDMAREERMGTDCASSKELYMSEMLGFIRQQVMLTSNATHASLFRQANEMGAIINFDDITHIKYFQDNVGKLPKLVSLRYNPGNRMAGGNSIIGKPGEQKYGIMFEQMPEAIRQLKAGGVERIGLHQMIVSNELNENNLIESANRLMQFQNELAAENEVKFAFANFGGGLGIPYRPEQIPVDVNKVAQGIRNFYMSNIMNGPNHGLQLKMESGRWLTGDSAVLLMKALHLEQKPRGPYVKVDASGNDFARVEAYGCYQHLNVLGKSGNSIVYSVAGPKCENSDHWAINRLLPKVDVGDILSLSGAGAHGHPMAPGYNGFVNCGEVLHREDGSFEIMTRPQTLKDQMAKYDFPSSRFKHLIPKV